MKKRAYVIGLTGPTGSGKTTVSRLLSQNGCYVIDADIVARKVVEKGSDCLNEIAGFFGSDIIDENGNLLRRKLGDIVFNDKAKLKALDNIIYPYIIKEITREIEGCASKIAVIDAPTLFESGCNKICDKVLVVTAEKELRLNRIVLRDNITYKQAEARANSQYSDEFFAKNADFIFDNTEAEPDYTELLAWIKSIKNNCDNL